MNTRYYELTEEQKLAISQAEFETAVTLEAVHRGIEIPIPLPEDLEAAPFIAFHVPARMARVYEIISRNQFSSLTFTGVAYKTQEEAERALEGAMMVEHDTYPKRINQIKEGEFAVATTFIPVLSERQVTARIDPFTRDTKEFDKLVEECRDDWQNLHQKAYDLKVLQQKRARYLALAEGNEAIAAAFWRNVEKTEWPATP